MAFIEYITFKDFNEFVKYTENNNLFCFVADKVIIQQQDSIDENIYSQSITQSISIQTLVIKSEVINVKNWFSRFNQLKQIHIHNLEISPTLNKLDSMFSNCFNVKIISLCWHCPNIESTQSMFENCESLATFNGFVQFSSKLENAKFMFKQCKVITPKTINWLKTYNAKTDDIFTDCIYNQQLIITLNNNNKQTVDKFDEMIEDMSDYIYSEANRVIKSINSRSDKLNESINSQSDSIIKFIDSRLEDTRKAITKWNDSSIKAALVNIRNITDCKLNSIEELKNTLENIESTTSTLLTALSQLSQSVAQNNLKVAQLENKLWTPQPKFTIPEVIKHIQEIKDSVAKNQELRDLLYSDYNAYINQIVKLFQETYGWERIEPITLKRLIKEGTKPPHFN